MKEKDLKAVNIIYTSLKEGKEIGKDDFVNFEKAVIKFNEDMEKRKQNYKNNADKFKERTKKWREENAVRKAEYQKEYMQRDYVKEKMSTNKKKKRKECHER